MKKNVLIGLIVALVPLFTFADIKVSSSTTIEKIYTYKTAAVIKLSKAMAKNSGCTYDKSGQFVALRFSEEGSKEMFSALLTAKVAKQIVTIGTSGCDNIWSGDGTMNKIYRITLQ